MVAVACLVATAGVARGERRVLRANFHAHARGEAIDDDGNEATGKLHEAVRAAGFDFSLHTPHGYAATATAEGWTAQRAAEAKLKVPGLTVAVGQELTVADGPQYQRRTTVLGQKAPGNLNHLALFGHASYVPYRALTPAQACARVHAEGGVCIVNHPGPGPMMWEEGYWEAQEQRGAVDGIEVYNGQAYAGAGVDFEARYREATAYRGLGLKVAATTGADTHGPKSVARTQAKLAGMAGAASKLVRMMMPSSASARPELDAATLVWADGARVEDVLAAVKARRTVATYGLGDVKVRVDGLGEVRKTGDVKLGIALSRKFAEVTLYREGVAVQTWHDVDAVEWRETLRAPAAYVWTARDGGARLMTSAIWYEPSH